MFGRVLHPLSAFVVKDFLDAITSRRMIVLSILLGVVIVGATAGLSYTTLNISEENPPRPLEVWHLGADGVLTAVAFGIIPVLLPFLAIAIGHANIARDRARGIFELAVSKPVPPWGAALGKFLGSYLAIAIPTAALSLACILVVQTIFGVPLDRDLTTTFVINNFVLVALYLILTLAIATLLAAENVVALTTLIWLGFNGLRQTSFMLTFRMATILGAREATVYMVAAPDIATFTGLYLGFMAPSVPDALQFVVVPEASTIIDQFVRAALPWAGFAWIVGLFLVYAFFLRRIPAK